MQNPAGQSITQTITYDLGQSWSVAVLTYDVAHGDALAQTDGTHADGSGHSLIVNDTAGLFNWSQYTLERNLAGQNVTQTILYDAGNPWTQAVLSYDVAHGDAVAQTVGTHADGSGFTTFETDTVGNQPWASYVLQQNALGQPLSQALVYRPGNTASTATFYYDVAHGGAVASESLVKADGSGSTVYAYDTAGAGVWQSTVADTNPAGQLVDMHVTWDPGQTNTTSLWLFDTSNQKLAAIYDYHPDGSYDYKEYNTSHVGQPWSEFAIHADKYGRTFGVSVLDQFGNGYSLYINPLATYSAANEIALNSELHAAPGYQSQVYNWMGSNGQIWVDQHYATLAALGVGNSIAQAAINDYALGHAHSANSIITVEVLGFGP